MCCCCRFAYLILCFIRIFRQIFCKFIQVEAYPDLCTFLTYLFKLGVNRNSRIVKRKIMAVLGNELTLDDSLTWMWINDRKKTTQMISELNRMLRRLLLYDSIKLMRFLMFSISNCGFYKCSLIGRFVVWNLSKRCIALLLRRFLVICVTTLISRFNFFVIIFNLRWDFMSILCHRYPFRLSFNLFGILFFQTISPNFICSQCLFWFDRWMSVIWHW